MYERGDAYIESDRVYSDPTLASPCKKTYISFNPHPSAYSIPVYTERQTRQLQEISAFCDCSSGQCKKLEYVTIYLFIKKISIWIVTKKTLSKIIFPFTKKKTIYIIYSFLIHSL